MKQFLLLTLLIASLLTSCTGGDGEGANAFPPAAPGLFSPIQLSPDTTLVYLEDYFPNGEWPDMMGAQGLGMSMDKENRSLKLYPEEGTLPSISLMELGFGSTKFHIPLKRSRMEVHRFEYDAKDQSPEKVQIAGSMTNWNPEGGTMQEENGKWVLEMPLNPGLYQYQVVVDGEWMLDPGNPVTVDNGIGGFNSQLTIGGGAEKEVEWELVQDADNSFLLIEKKGKVVVEALWENEKVEVLSMASKDRYMIVVPENASKLDRSHLRIFVGDPSGKVEDFLIPLEKGLVVKEPSQLTSEDQHANILYFMLVDRFYNGDTTNDRPVMDERVHPKANYHGGDLAGVRAKLDEGFFDELGINTIWISPLNQNPEGAYQEFPEPRRWFSGYHGYWPISSSRVDHRFGSNELLKDFVTAAHDKNHKVILDFVANHVHEEHPLLAAHPDWKTPLYLEDSSLNIRLWDAQRLTTWFDDFLPSLDFAKPEVIETQSDSALFWLSEFGIDGFRHDATKHIPETFWRRLTQKIKTEVDRPMFQIGETFGSRSLIGDYVGSGMMDGQFDFNLYFDLRRVLTDKEPNAGDIVQSLNASLAYYGYHSLMGNISGNHDMPRFIATAGGDLKPEEDPKEAGWNRHIGVSDPVGYRKLEQLHAFLMCAPGLPVIYYGDEFGMSGANDPDNRRDMRFEGYSEDEQRVREVCKGLIQQRKNSMALLYGNTEAFAPDKESFVLVRRYFGEEVVLVLNLSDKKREISLPEGLSEDHMADEFDALKRSEEGVSAEVEAHGFQLFAIK